MRRSGATPWFAALTLLGSVLFAGCGEDKSSTVSDGDPFLQVRVNSSCDQNTLPVTTPEELQSQSMERAQVVVTGGDPTRPSGELATGTEVFMYVGNDKGLPSGTGGSFLSTLGGESLTGEPKTTKFPYSPPSVTDEFFCTKVGLHYIYAGVEKYEPTGQAILMPQTEGFPVRCIEHAKWMCDCRQQCGPQDAAVPDAALPDAALPDMAIPDAALVDAGDAAPDAEPDAAPPPSVWRMDFAGPMDAAEFQLQVRGAAAAGARTDVLLQYRITENGMPRPGIRIDFEKVRPAIGDVRVDPLFGLTNEDGIASTLVQAGDTPGQVRVMATATLPDTGDAPNDPVDELSPPISISSGLPSLTNFAFGCVDPVITGFTHRVYDPATTPPDGDRWFVGIHDGTDCTFALADRLGNRIPEGTPVRFMTEGGSIDDVVRADDNGRGTTSLLVTSPHPGDVAPLDWESQGGHATANGPLTYNPRDGLIRIVASTRGEEGFLDVNGDHQYTDGVDTFGPGYDLGEPFVDVNDNNTWDEGEEYDDVDGDGLYTPGNGVWDANTVIWRSTLVLWNGDMNGNLSRFGPVPCDPAQPGRCGIAGAGSPCENSGADFNLVAGRIVDFSLLAVDDNANCLASRQTGSITITATSDSATYGAPVWALSRTNAEIVRMDYAHCYDPSPNHSVPERPMGWPHGAAVRFTPPEPDDDDAPRAVGGVVKFDVTYQNGLAELQTVTLLRTYCLDLTAAP